MESAELFLADPQGVDMLLTAYRGPFIKAFSQITRFSPGEGLPGLVQSSGEPIVISRLAEDTRYLRTQVKDRGFHSYVSVPLHGPEGIIGVLNVATRKPDPDLERAMRLLTWASQPISTVLQIGLLHVRENIGNASLEVTQDSAGGFDDLLRAVLHRIMLIGNARGGALTVYDSSARGAVRRVKEGEFADVVCIDVQAQEPQMCPVIVRGRGLALKGPRYQWPPSCRHLPAKSGLVYCLPLPIDGDRVGIVQLGYAGSVPSPATRYLATLLTAAGQAAPVVRQAWKNHLEQERNLRFQNAMSPAALSDAIHEDGWSGESTRKGCKADSAPIEPFLDIRCFGGFELYRQRKLLTPEIFQRRGALTVLKILVLHCGRPVRRDTLIELLWPEVNPEAGVNRLHVLLHSLRRMIEPPRQGQPWLYICNDGDRYYFNPEAPYHLDVGKFRDYIGLAERLERNGDVVPAIDAYEAAVSLYRGDLLEDEAYAEWCRGEREHLRETCLTALKRLAIFYLEHDATERSIQRFRQALRMDDLREENHRSLMYALWSAGRRDEALRQYEICRDTLIRDLDVAPLQETEDLYFLISNNGVH
jgi:DNA-binding SARP family transcriptional activator